MQNFCLSCSFSTWCCRLGFIKSSADYNLLPNNNSGDIPVVDWGCDSIIEMKSHLKIKNFIHSVHCLLNNKLEKNELMYHISPISQCFLDNLRNGLSIVIPSKSFRTYHLIELPISGATFNYLILIELVLIYVCMRACVCACVCVYNNLQNGCKDLV